MRQTNLERSIVEKLKPAIIDVTPGVVVRAYHMGRLICDIEVGHTYPYYDLASLTKVFFTQQAMMRAFDQGLWTMDSKVGDFLKNFLFPDIKVHSLLTHTSGLDWWKPFYQMIGQGKSAIANDFSRSRNTWLDKRGEVYKILNQNDSYKPTEKALYSDLGFITLGFILEKLEQKNLLEIWRAIKEDYYANTTVDFHVNNVPLFSVDQYAPTEECPYRQKVMRGEVHDENTWSFGGISSHAGLFGSIDDLSTMALNVRSQLTGIARYKVRQKTAQLFATRAIAPEIGDWAMGYMMPSAEGASCGPHFSVHSIGHTGFTGTSFWYDPRHDLLLLILSNRVNYGRENRRFVQLRPQIHTWIFESIKRTI